MDLVLKTVSSTNLATEDSRPSKEEAEAAVRLLLEYIGENPDREGLIETPKRVVKAFGELYGGYDKDPADVLERTFSEVGGYQDIVLMRDINFSSHCEHHMVPFVGKAHIAYYPNAQVVGLSKLARLVEIFTKRLQTQENLTAEITHNLHDILQPKGVAVYVEAEHMCMTMRGVKAHGASTITTAFTGIFEHNHHEQQRFMDLVLKR